MPDLNVTSPAAAFARQARMEVRVERALEHSMRAFLTDALNGFIAEGQALGAAALHYSWAHHTSYATLRAQLPEEVARYLSDGLALSSVPDEAWTSGKAVMQRAAEQAWSTKDREAALRAALSPDGGETILTPTDVSLTAAAVVKRDENGRPVYRATAGLDVKGSSWISRMRAEARTSVTGLDGILSTAAMRQQRLPYKQWVTRHDEHVRPTHAAAGGQTVPIDEQFIVGGYGLDYPGDRGGPAGEVINCRCITVGTDHEVRGTTALPFIAP